MWTICRAGRSILVATAVLEVPMSDVFRLLDERGQVVAGAAALPPVEELLAGYRALVNARRLNEQASALVRQGRLAVYPSSHGQEACQVAAVTVLGERDWLFPTYRDTAAVVARGVPPAEALTLLRGTWHCGYDPIATRVAPQATPLATQLPHAVGVAHAARLKGEDSVVLAMCGDGGTSEGDFHEALNFAAVFAAPVVFLVQNNKYAISVPLARQSAAVSLADKGIGYGMPAVLVDGNDFAALTTVLSEAVRRARAGGGPTLVEADTYRIEAHTNADDATRYRDDDEVAGWLARDPLLRLRAHLTGRGALDADLEAEITEDAEAMAARVRADLAAEQLVDPDELFAHVYARRTAQLAEQAALLRAELAADTEMTSR
jgi:pyruvate dehydrogenase E1 component alpha subunit